MLNHVSDIHHTAARDWISIDPIASFVLHLQHTLKMIILVNHSEATVVCVLPTAIAIFCPLRPCWITNGPHYPEGAVVKWFKKMFLLLQGESHAPHDCSTKSVHLSQIILEHRPERWKRMWTWPLIVSVVGTAAHSMAGGKLGVEVNGFMRISST